MYEKTTFSLSRFLCFYSERDGEANNRESYIYICIYIHTHMQARHLRNHVSVPLLRSHACSSPQFPRASIEKRFHGAMLAILASIDSFHPLVPRSSLFPTLSRIFKSGMETRTNFPSRNRWPISYGYIYIYIERGNRYFISSYIYQIPRIKFATLSSAGGKIAVEKLSDSERWSA